MINGEIVSGRNKEEQDTNQKDGKKEIKNYCPQSHESQQMNLMKCVSL